MDWKDPEQVRAYRREYDRKRRSTPEFKAKQAEYDRKRRSTPEFKAKQAEYSRKYEQTRRKRPEGRREYLRAYQKAHSEKHNEVVRKYREENKAWINLKNSTRIRFDR